jgi:hypothetical protein
MELTILKYTLKTMKRAGRYVFRKKGRKNSDRKRTKMKFGARLTLLAAFFFASICVLALSSGNFGWLSSSQGETSGNSISSTMLSVLASNPSTRGIANGVQKATTLQASSSTRLTLYPSKSTNALSSATVDEQTGKLSYMQNAGEGGVAIVGPQPPPPAAKPTETACQQAQDALAKANHDGSNLPVASCDSSQDFLTGENIGANGTGTYSGVLFQIPAEFTTSNSVVETLEGAMAGVAVLLLVPIILMIGLSYMSGGGTFRYADALDALPRLVLSLIAVASCLFLSSEIISIGNALIQLFMDTLNSVPKGIIEDPTSILMPSGQWQAWLTTLSAMGGMLIMAQVIAPIAFAGFTVGAYFSIGMVAAAYGVLIGYAPKFILTSFSMVVAAQVILRFMLVDVYIVLAPIAMIAAGLPGQTGTRFAREWIMGFLSLIAAQFSVVVALGAGLIVLGEAQNVEKDTGIVITIIKYATLALMMRVPSLFKTSAVDLMRQAGPLAATIAHSEGSPLAPS